MEIEIAASYEPKMNSEVRIFENSDEMSTDLAEYISQVSEISVKERGYFAIALSGGPLVGIMRKLCEAPYSKTLDWSKWYIFWADEGAVSKNHVESNYKLTKEGFLSKLAIPKEVSSMFHASTAMHLGNGTATLFWTDRWLQGDSIQSFAPGVFDAVSARAIRSRTVQQAIHQSTWISDIEGNLNLQGIVDFNNLVTALHQIALGEDDEEDCLSWRWSADGSYSAKSAYEAFFYGQIQDNLWQAKWSCWAPRKCKIFMHLAIANRCWTADRLARRGLDHPPSCLLCDQHEETISHLLVQCSFSRQVPILNGHVYSINDNAMVEDAATDYEFVIRQLVKIRTIGVSESNDYPKFDLILLGC